MRWAAAALLAVLALTGCTRDGEAPADRVARSGTVEVAAEPGAISWPFAADGRVYRGADEGRPLAGPLSDALVGALTPLLVPNPGGDVLVYQSWSGRRPVLRVHDAESGRDALLVDGALSIAWREGRIAYVRALRPDVSVPKRYVGHVVVRPGLTGREARWTPSPGRYVVAAWAGRRLLVYRLGESWPDLLALARPGRVRLLARAGALVAVSPDGRRAFLARYGASPPTVRVVEVATGRELERLSLPGMRWVTESGSWSAGRVTAATSEGVAVFDVRDGRLQLEQVLRFPPEEFQFAGLEPRLDASGGRVTAWASLAPRPREAVGAAVVVECDRFTLRCARSAPFPETPGPRVVYNPSRP